MPLTSTEKNVAKSLLLGLVAHIVVSLLMLILTTTKSEINTETLQIATWSVSLGVCSIVAFVIGTKLKPPKRA